MKKEYKKNFFELPAKEKRRILEKSAEKASELKKELVKEHAAAS